MRVVGDTATFSARMRRARTRMAEESIGVMLLSVGADLPYLTGYEATQTERLTMAVVPADGEAVIVVPRLEAARIEPHPGVFSVRPWDETEDPVAMVAGLAGEPPRAAIGNLTWAVFLLGLQQLLPATEFVPAEPVMSELRMRKDAAEVAALRRAAAAVDRVVGRLSTGYRFSGKSERRLAREVAEMTLEEGHQIAPFAIVAAGPNGASPHHEAGERRIATGDAVVVDFGGRYDGYCSDTTRTFHVGEPSGEVLEAYEVLRAAQAAAVESARVGTPLQEIDRTARRTIDGGGYGEYFIHRTGHGIGLEVHEQPYVVEGSERPLEPGMAFSVEPGIYVPGRFGMRIEDIVVATAGGPDRLNRSPRHLVVVE